jgi:pyrroline-5-carboxylate reductase
MAKTGFIGCGHMGSALLEGMLEARVLAPAEVLVATRTRERLDPLLARRPGVEAAGDNASLAARCGRIFICVGTYQVRAVLDEIGASLGPSCHLVVMSGGLEIGSVERIYGGPVTKILPTILAKARRGTTLVCHGERVPEPHRLSLRALLEGIGSVEEIDESLFDQASDFTSCAPGLIASLLDNYVRAGAAEGALGLEKAQRLLLDCLGGTFELMRSEGLGLEELMRRVATRGGATEGGIEVLDERLPEVFADMLAAMRQRHETRKAATRAQFEEPARP